MIKTQAIQASETGEFFIKFEASDITNKTHNFYGHKVNKLEAYKRYGNLPDNNIIGNKLINILGRNLLNLEKEKVELDAKEPLKNVSDSRRAEIERYAFMERESNAFNISVLSELTYLEQERFGIDPSLDPANAKLELDKLATKHTAAQTKINTMYEERLQRIQEQIGYLSVNPNEAQKVQIARLESLKSEIIDKQKTTFDLLKNKLIDYAKDPNVLDQLRSGSKSAIFGPWTMQTVYRQIMENFASEQRIISQYQHRSDRPLDFANQSLTEAYQNASYAMEGHVYSTQKPTDEQLWIPNPADKNAIVIDSRHQPKMRKLDALYATSLLAENDNGKEDTFTSLEDAKARKAKSTAIYKANENTKEAIKKVSKTNKEAREANQKTKTRKKLTRLTLQEAEENAAKVEDNTRDLTNELLEELTTEKDTKNNNANFVSKVVTPEDAIDDKFCEKADKLAKENEVHIYEVSNLFAAMGFACMDFGKYFENEMSAKSPVKTGMLFVLVAATFGGATMAAGGSAMGKMVFNQLANAITFKGGLGVSPEHFKHAVDTVNHKWLQLTWSQDGGLMRELIMTAFALPKLNYVLVDTVLNQSEHRDTITRIAQRISEQETGYKLPSDELKVMVRNIMTVALLFGTAIALGMFANWMAMLTPEQAHHLGLGNPETLNHLGEQLSIFVEGNPEIYSDIGLAQPALAEFEAILAAVLTLKSAGLFLGKAYLVLSHMGDGVPEKERSAFLLMAGLKEMYDAGKPIDVNHPDFLAHKAHFELILARDMTGFNGFLRDSSIEKLFGTEFLDNMGIRRPPSRGVFKKVFGGIANAFIWLGDNTWRKVILPSLQIGAGVLYVPFVGWWLHPGTDPWGIKTAVKSFYLGITSGLIMFWSAIKTVANAAWGTAQRVVQEALNITFGLVSVINFMVQSVREGHFKEAFRGILYGVGKLVLPAVSVVADLIHFTGKMIDGAVKWSLRAVLGIAFSIPLAIAGIYGAATGQGGKPASNLWDNVLKVFTSPLVVGRILSAPQRAVTWITTYFQFGKDVDRANAASRQVLDTYNDSLSKFRVSKLVTLPIGVIGLAFAVPYKWLVTDKKDLKGPWVKDLVAGMWQFVDSPNSVKDHVANELHRVNTTKIDTVTGSAAINKVRDTSIKWTGFAFNGLKKVFATPIYVVRNIFVRNIEEGIQQVNFSAELNEKLKDEISLHNPNKLVGLGKSTKTHTPPTIGTKSNPNPILGEKKDSKLTEDDEDSLSATNIKSNTV